MLHTHCWYDACLANGDILTFVSPLQETACFFCNLVRFPPKMYLVCVCGRQWQCLECIFLSLPGTLMILKSACSYNSSYIDRLISVFMRSLQKMVREHLSPQQATPGPTEASTGWEYTHSHAFRDTNTQGSRLTFPLVALELFTFSVGGTSPSFGHTYILPQCHAIKIIPRNPLINYSRC